MRKYILLCFCWSLLFIASTFAETYQSEHFIIHSDLDPRYVQFIQANSESYYNNMVNSYFKKGWQRPLAIYYSETQAGTKKLLSERGYKDEVGYGRYLSSETAVYTHRLMNNGEHSGWGTLFHEITHHFVHLNYSSPPAWFNEGLTCFLSEQTRIVKGKLTVGRPNPWREQILRDKMEKGVRPNLKRLFSTSTEQFYSWDLGYHFSRAFFYWLYENGYLEKYLENVQKKGYELSVLIATVPKSYGEINVELLNFIKKHCYAGAYLKDGWQSKDEVHKKEALRKAVELKPDYTHAQLALAECLYKSGDNEKCREHLKQILQDTESIEYREAAELMGKCYYRDKDYERALEYYQKALDYSDYYEYKYVLYYWMANCHHFLKDRDTAKKLYKTFLDNNWELERLSEEVKYATEYGIRKKELNKK